MSDALLATQRNALSGGDYNLNFSANRRSRSQRALEYLILMVPPTDLPKALKNGGDGSSAGGGGSGGGKGAKGKAGKAGGSKDKEPVSHLS